MVFKKGMVPWNTGKKMSDAYKKHLSDYFTGKTHSKKTKKLMSVLAKDRAKSKAWRKRVSEGTKKAYKRPEVIANRKLAVLKYHGNRWEGGISYKKNGYKLVYKPSHPNSMVNGYIMEHRLVMSEHLGRPLDKDEVVHHIDHDITNNNISNLELFESKSAHRIHHAKLRQST